MPSSFNLLSSPHRPDVPGVVVVEPRVDHPRVDGVNPDIDFLGLKLAVQEASEHDLGRLRVAVSALGAVELPGREDKNVITIQLSCRDSHLRQSFPSKTFSVKHGGNVSFHT